MQIGSKVLPENC